MSGEAEWIKSGRSPTYKEAFEHIEKRNLTWLSSSPEYWNGEDHMAVRAIIFHAKTCDELLSKIPNEIKLEAFAAWDKELSRTRDGGMG